MTGLFAIRLYGIMADLEHRLEKQTADHGRSIVARDLELEALRQQEEKMRLEIVQLKENTDKLVLITHCTVMGKRVKGKNYFA